jgi:hypothetical protein
MTFRVYKIVTPEALKKRKLLDNTQEKKACTLLKYKKKSEKVLGFQLLKLNINFHIKLHYFKTLF